MFVLNSTVYGQSKIFAGASAIDITPTPEMKVFQGKRVHDKLHSKAIILDNGKEKLALVVVDNQGIPTWIIDSLKKKIEKQTEIKKSNILISSTHTHSGVYAGEAIESRTYGVKFDEYQAFLVERISEGVAKATRDMKEALIGWGQFDAPDHVFNRRWFVKDAPYNPFGLQEKVKMNPGFDNPSNLIKPAGPIDPQVWYLAIKGIDETPLAVFANYSLHYVGAFPNDFSADYFSLFGEKVGKFLSKGKHHKDFVGIMSNGTSGDVSNQNFSLPNPKRNLYERQELVSDDLARKLAANYKNIKFHRWVPFNIISENCTLEIRKVTNDITKSQTALSKMKVAQQKGITTNSRSVNSTTKGSSPAKSFIHHPLEDTYLKRVPNFAEQFPKQIIIPLQAIAIGDLAIGAIPFEVFAETGLLLKEKSPYKHYFTVGIANGHWGYLPTRKQIKLGGYETWFTVNRVEANSEKIISSNMLKILNDLKTM